MATKRKWKEFCSDDISAENLISNVARVANAYAQSVATFEKAAHEELSSEMEKLKTSLLSTLENLETGLHEQIAENAALGRSALTNAVTYCPQTAPAVNQSVVIGSRKIHANFACLLRDAVYVVRGTTVLHLPTEILVAVMLMLDPASRRSARAACKRFSLAVATAQQTKTRRQISARGRFRLPLKKGLSAGGFKFEASCPLLSFRGVCRCSPSQLSLNLIPWMIKYSDTTAWKFHVFLYDNETKKTASEIPSTVLTARELLDEKAFPNVCTLAIPPASVLEKLWLCVAVEEVKDK